VENNIVQMVSFLPGSLFWKGTQDSTLPKNEEEIRKCLLKLEKPVWVVQSAGSTGITNEGEMALTPGPVSLIGFTGPLTIDSLGDRSFCKTYNTLFAYYAGAMANGIASVDLVISLGRAGYMASFGAGGLSPDSIETAIVTIKDALPGKPFAFNLLNSPGEPALERKVTELYLKHGIRVIEASAYLTVSSSLVYYRASGLSLGPDNQIEIGNRIIVKLSRKEVARRFLAPPPAEILRQLVEEKRITEQQANLAQQVPVADDVTVEADSGGHTDNRPLVCLVPAMLALRDEFQEKYHYAQLVRVGAGGGIGTPSAALAAFMMGAAYIVTGSVNQACVEANASEHTRKLLAQAEMTDVSMAPAGDMFEMGVRVQVLKRGTMFPMRAQKLYELYTHYESWEAIPTGEREKLETQVFKKGFDSIWNDCEQFFSVRDPKQIERANKNPKDKMALVFRWYLGLSSRWSNTGQPDREMDYQIWCGPAMGAFNDWVRGTTMGDIQNRHVVDVAREILTGCAYLYRLKILNAQGIKFTAGIERYPVV